VHYFTTVPPLQRDIMRNDTCAFEYSLMKTKETTDGGFCLPLMTGLKFMRLRSQGQQSRRLRDHFDHQRPE